MEAQRDFALGFKLIYSGELGGDLMGGDNNNNNEGRKLWN